MPSVEINKRLGILGVYPNLAQHTRVNGTHEFLPEDIEAMCNVYFDHMIFVCKRTFA